jgi:phage protein D
MSSSLGTAAAAGFSQILGSGTRGVWPTISIAGTDVSQALYSNLMSVSYNQTYADTFDDVTIKLADPSLLFSQKFKLVAGTAVSLGFKTVNWRFPGDSQQVNFGSFVIDEVQYLNPPGAAVIKCVDATAVGISKWSNITSTWGGTLLTIGQQIAKRAGLTLQANPASFATTLGNIAVSPGSAVQSNCSDLVFYDELCRRYYVSTKVHSGILWVFDQMSLDGQTPVAVLTNPVPGVIGGVGLGLKESSFTISLQNNNYAYADSSGNYVDVKTGKLITTKVQSETIDESASGSTQQLNAQPAGQAPPTVNAIRSPIIPSDTD